MEQLRIKPNNTKLTFDKFCCMDKNIVFIQSSIHFKSLSCFESIGRVVVGGGTRKHKQTGDCGLTGTGSSRFAKNNQTILQWCVSDLVQSPNARQ